MLPERRSLPLPLAPTQGEVRVELAVLSESHQGNQKFPMAYSSTPSTHCWEPRGRMNGARKFQKGSR